MTLKSPGSQVKPDLHKIILLVACACVFLLVPLKISSYGYFPPDDALRHVAHALDVRPWSSTLILDPELRTEVDSHPGWHGYLAASHRWLNFSPDQMVTLSYVTTFVFFGWCGLVGSLSPAAWVGAFSVMAILDQGFIYRLMLGRPFAITMAILVVLLFDWARNPKRRGIQTVGFHAALLSIAVWAHPSAWYVWLGVIACVWLSRGIVTAMRALLSLGIALLLVTLVTGSFYNTVSYPVLHLLHALGSDPGRLRNLVTEFQPTGGPFIPLIVVTIILVVRHYSNKGERLREDLLEPTFVVFIAMWILGLKITRFWVDWGQPAFLVWVCLQFTKLPGGILKNSREKVALVLCTVGVIFVNSSVDIAGRFTDSLTSVILHNTEASLEDIKPKEGGTVYNIDMQYFYRMYYRFPHADIHYVLGFEPGMMRKEDLATYRDIQTVGDLNSYAPWFAKMTEKDCIILYTSSKPSWATIKFEKFFGVWVGRKMSAEEQAKAKLEPKTDSTPQSSTAPAGIIKG